MSKVAASLLSAGLLEEVDAPELARGRPAPKLRLATGTAQVLGIAIDAGHCEVIAAGLTGAPAGTVRIVPTPGTYPELLAALEPVGTGVDEAGGRQDAGSGPEPPRARRLPPGSRRAVAERAAHRRPRAGGGPRRAARPAGVLLQESHALCLAERDHGLAKGLDDFAMLDVSTGSGWASCSAGGC